MREDVHAALSRAEMAMRAFVALADLRYQPSAFDRFQHAWMQGGFAAGSKWCVVNDCPYTTSDYRRAWRAGFDIARRIQQLAEERDYFRSIAEKSCSKTEY